MEQKKFELKKLWKIFFSRVFANKLIAYGLLIIFLFIFKNFLIVFFLTFIFWYLFFSIWKYIKEKFDYNIERHFQKNKKSIKKFVSLNKIITLLYVVFIIFIIFSLTHILPKIIDELMILPDKFPFIKNEVNGLITRLQDLVTLNNQLWWSIMDVVKTQWWDFNIFFDIFHRLKSAWTVFLKILISLIMSYIFIIDIKNLSKYFGSMKKTNFSFLYYEYRDFFKRIVWSFWKIFKAQALIALYNTIFTWIWLYLIWHIYWNFFPYFFTLMIFVFVCWLIPVLWTFISSIPILFIWYNIWWIQAIIYLIILIAIIHFIEAYFLNPRIVSSILRLPLSLTFMILLASEYLFWFTWLIIWIWLYYFLEWLFIDADKEIDKLLN